MPGAGAGGRVLWGEEGDKGARKTLDRHSELPVKLVWRDIDDVMVMSWVVQDDEMVMSQMNGVMVMSQMNGVMVMSQMNGVMVMS